MHIGSYCRRPISIVGGETKIGDAALRMSKEGVGLLAVLDAGHPIGVLADRDIALHEVIGNGDRVADAMNVAPVTIDSTASLSEAVDLMAHERLRRLMVVEDEGHALAVLEADDLVQREPVGVITDRYIAVRLVARGRDPKLTVLSAIMSSPVVACESTQPLEELVAKMKEHGIRRITVDRHLQRRRIVGTGSTVTKPESAAPRQCVWYSN